MQIILHSLRRKDFITSRLPLLAAALLSMPLASVTTHAAEQLTTLENLGGGNTVINQGNVFGFSFQVGASDYLLNSVTAAIFQSGTEGPWILKAAIYEAASSGPGYALPVGSALATFSYGVIPNTITYVTFTPTSTVTLSANGFYTFALIAENPLAEPGSAPSWSWMATQSATGYGPVDTDWNAIALLPYSDNEGATWSAYAGGTTDYRLKASIDATPVPEPSAFLFLAGGAGAAFLLRKRRVA